MAHKHNVYDTDLMFEVNPTTRQIVNKSTTKTTLIQFDHNSERFTFKIPRSIDGHDMSTCDMVQIHYLNIDASNRANQVAGVYEVTDLHVSPDDEDTVLCSWLISRNATQLIGSLHFLIRFMCTTEGVVDYTWNTAVFTGISISTGINNAETIEEEYADIIAQWKDQLFSDGAVTIDYIGTPYMSKETVVGGYINATTGAFIKDSSFIYELFKIDGSKSHEVDFATTSSFVFIGTVKNWNAEKKSATPVVDIIQCTNRHFTTTPSCEYIYIVHTKTLDVESAVNLKIDGYNVMKTMVEHVAKLNEIVEGLSINPFKNKKISIFGDSISTFEGFLTPSKNITFYKTTDDYNTGVTNHRYTWWQKVCTMHQAILEVNNSYSNSAVNASIIKNGVETIQPYAFINRVEDNDLGSPDFIFVCGGTNDDFQNQLNPDYTIVNLGNITDYSGLVASTDFTDDIKKTFKGAFAYVLVRLKELYPNAQIVNISYSALRDATGVKGAMAEICKVYDVKNIVLNGVETVDYIHPTKEGMSNFYKQVVKAFGVTPENDALFDSFIVGEQTDNASNIEPIEEDIPKIFFGSALPQTKDDAVMPFRYISKTKDIKGYCTTKAQGNSSMSYPKKNQTVKLYEDLACTKKLKVDFKGWGKQNKFCFKANWIDISHARNVVSARLWADVVRSRENYEELPELYRTSPNQGSVDGFPVKVYADGIYQGRYTLNIPKDAWMSNMDEDLNEHCILCSENYVSGCFRATAKLDETDWTDELHDTVPNAIKDKWNEIINFVISSSNEDFKTRLGDYFYIDSLIDYHLFGLAICHLDGYGKNQLYMTYDGQKWIAQVYDMDSTWGLYWNGNSIVSSTYRRDQYEDLIQGRNGNLLFMRLEECFFSEIQARWAELKNGALSVENIINRFERFTDIADKSLIEEDYATTTGGGKFTNIPSKTTNNIQQIRLFAKERQTWTDAYVEGLIYSACESITFDSTTLRFNGEGQKKTIRAMTVPMAASNYLTWESDNNAVATVNINGVVTAWGNGTANITAKCGDITATCVVTVEGIQESTLLYSIPTATTFKATDESVIDTGVKLFDENKDFTIVIDFANGETNAANAVIYHCMHEASPYDGLTFNVHSGTNKVMCQNQGMTMNDVADTTRTRVVVTHAFYSPSSFKGYCTGKEVQSMNWPGGIRVLNETLVLGGYTDTSGNHGRYWNGTVYDFKVFNRVLTEEELTTLLVNG